jgi:hypothetical protein
MTVHRRHSEGKVWPHPPSSANREDLTKKIGTRPTSKPDLITKYQKEFSAFVESIDFDALQQSTQ